MEAVLRRSPQVCVIDPLAAKNPPEVAILIAGKMCRSLHVGEYKEKVQAITGKDTAETIPKSFLLAADCLADVEDISCMETDSCRGFVHFALFSGFILARNDGSKN